MCQGMESLPRHEWERKVQESCVVARSQLPIP